MITYACVGAGVAGWWWCADAFSGTRSRDYSSYMGYACTAVLWPLVCLAVVCIALSGEHQNLVA